MTTVGRRRHRVWPWLVAALVLAIAGGTGGYLAYARHNHGHHLVNPAVVRLPQQHASASTVRSYFAHNGKGLLVLLHDTRQVSAATTKASCILLARKISLAGSPAALTNAAIKTPDQNLSAAAVNHVQSVGSYLARCGTQPDLASEATQVSFTATVLSRMLARDGVR